MLDGLHVAVIVPAYNEERHIAQVLTAMPPFVDRVLVIDDASTDATVPRVRERADARVTLVRHTHNRGVGAALTTGYQAAFAAGADVAVVMAGDGQMDPADLGALLAPICRGEADYVKGDRLSWPGVVRVMPLPRLVGNHVLSALTRAATGLPVHDSQCGYTALTRTAARRLRLELLWPRYGYPNDLLSAAAAAGLRVRDVPVRPVYGEEQSGIGFRHAVFVVPFVLLRATGRRLVGQSPLSTHVEHASARPAILASARPATLASTGSGAADESGGESTATYAPRAPAPAAVES